MIFFLYLSGIVLSLSVSLSLARCLFLSCSLSIPLIYLIHSFFVVPLSFEFSFLSLSLSVLSSLFHRVCLFLFSFSLRYSRQSRRKLPFVLKTLNSRCHALKILPHSLPRVYHAKGVQELGRQKQPTSTWNCHGTAFKSGVLFPMDEKRDIS